MGLLSAVILGVSTLFAVLLLNTLRSGAGHSVGECTPDEDDYFSVTETSDALKRFQTGLRLQTVSYEPQKAEYEELFKLRKHIETSYPTVHSSPIVKYDIVSNYSLLYLIQGSDMSLTPYMLCAHLDVVPADASTWDAAPFGANVINGFIYARGTIDFKHGVFGILEALEFMLKRGVVPRRSFYVAFGHDEEVTGYNGAGEIAKILTAQGVKLAFILDEGLTVLDGFIPGINTPIAGIGTSEKGYLTLRLSVETTGGHSSMPGKESCIGILSQAVKRLEENPHPSRFGTGPERSMFEYIAHRFPFPMRMVMSNLWLFGPLVSIFLSNKPSTNALIRTTTAVTQFQAGVKENVIAQTAWATVNHRLHPYDNVKEVLEFDRTVINDARVKIEVIAAHEPLPLSPFGEDVYGFEVVRTSIRQVWSHHDVTVAPGLMVGGTDTKHYTLLSDQIYRFSPTYMYPEDAKRFHGINERISVENYQDAVNFYYHVMRNSDRVDFSRHGHSHEL